MTKTIAPPAADDLLAVSLADVIEAEATLSLNDTPFARRQFVRAVFATIEGLIAHLRDELLSQTTRRRFTAAELTLLREETYVLEPNGRPKASARWLPIAPSLLFLWRLYTGPLRSAKLRIDTSGREWTRFKVAVDVRHRITHPKRLSELDVTDREVRAVNDTGVWLLRLHQESQHRHLARDRGTLKRREQQLAAAKESLVRAWQRPPRTGAG